MGLDVIDILIIVGTLTFAVCVLSWGLAPFFSSGDQGSQQESRHIYYREHTVRRYLHFPDGHVLTEETRDIIFESNGQRLTNRSHKRLTDRVVRGLLSDEQS